MNGIGALQLIFKYYKRNRYKLLKIKIYKG